MQVVQKILQTTYVVFRYVVTKLEKNTFWLFFNNILTTISPSFFNVYFNIVKRNDSNRQLTEIDVSKHKKSLALLKLLVRKTFLKHLHLV